MGKGDKKTKRGKIILGSYGVRRPRKKSYAAKKDATPQDVSPVIEVKVAKAAKVPKESTSHKESKPSRVKSETKKEQKEIKTEKTAKAKKDKQV